MPGVIAGVYGGGKALTNPIRASETGKIASAGRGRARAGDKERHRMCRSLNRENGGRAHSGLTNL